jgi:hypothetical protein
MKSPLKNLQIFLWVYGVMSLLIFGTLFIAFVFQIPQFDPGGSLNWMIWDDLQGHVGLMIVTIYLVWAIYFFVAAKAPEQNISFLKFSMWANLVHGLVMIPLALDGTHLYHSKFITDIPFILGISLGLYLLMPSARSEVKKDQGLQLR